MPQIPQYNREASLPAIERPSVPGNAGQEIPQAWEKVGHDVAGLVSSAVSAVSFGMQGGFKDLFKSQGAKLQEQSNLVNLQSESALKLQQMRLDTTNSEEFYSNPEGSLQTFSDNAKKMQQEYMAQIPNQKLQLVFQKGFSADMGSSLEHLQSAVSKLRMNQGQAKYEQGLLNYQHLANNSPSESETLRYMGMYKGTLDQMQSIGLITPEKHVERWEKFQTNTAERRAVAAMGGQDSATVAAAENAIRGGQGIYSLLDANARVRLADSAVKKLEHLSNVSRQDLQKANEERENAAVSFAYQTVYKDFNLTDAGRGDYAGAVKSIQDPANAELYQLVDKNGKPDAQLAGKVASMIETQRNQRISASSEAQKRLVETANNQMLGLYNQRKLTPDVIANSGLPEDKQAHWRSAVKAQSEEMDKTDSATFNREYSKILTGQTQSRSDIPLPGNGISGKDVAFLHGEWDKSQDPSRSRYYTMAGDEFQKLFANDKDVLAKKDEFLAILANEVKAGKLEGEAIYKRARELMKESGKGVLDRWFNGAPAYNFQTNQWLYGSDAAQYEKTMQEGQIRTQQYQDKMSIPTQEQGVSPAGVTNPVPKADPAVQTRVNELLKQHPAQRVKDDLKAKGIDPKLYGLGE